MHHLQKTLIVSFFLFITSSNLLRAEGTTDFSESINEFLDSSEFGKSPKLCDCYSAYETSSIYSPVNKKTIVLSIVSSKNATQLFKMLKEDHVNSFNFDAEGCFARAHRMVQKLDEEGVISGKIFAEGSIPFKSKHAEGTWLYHTAAVILVKKNGKNITTVIDPVLFDRPVSVDEWKKKLLKNPKAKIDRTFYTKRFIFNRDLLNLDLDTYDDRDTEVMFGYLKSFTRQAHMQEIEDLSSSLKKEKKK